MGSHASPVPGTGPTLEGPMWLFWGPPSWSHMRTVCRSRKGGSDLGALSAISPMSPNSWGSLFKGPKPRWQLGLRKEWRRRGGAGLAPGSARASGPFRWLSAGLHSAVTRSSSGCSSQWLPGCPQGPWGQGRPGRQDLFRLPWRSLGATKFENHRAVFPRTALGPFQPQAGSCFLNSKTTQAGRELALRTFLTSGG